MAGVVSRSVDRGGSESCVCRADQSWRQRTRLWLQGSQSRWVKEEDIVLNLRDDGVAPDDVGETCLLQCLQLASKENSLIPKSIAGAQALELIGDDFSKRRADARAENMILGQAADPKID